jgi:hypothetical protein
MTSDEIISSGDMLHIHEPMPEEIARAIGEARRLRAQTFRDTAARWLTRVLRGGEVRPVHTDNAANAAPTA